MTLRYRSLQADVEAFQLTKERRQDRAEWPAWLVEAAAKPRTQIGAVYVKNLSNPNAPDLLRLVTDQGVSLINFNDWLVEGEDGTLSLWPPGQFLQTYEPVE